MAAGSAFACDAIYMCPCDASDKTQQWEQEVEQGSGNKVYWLTAGGNKCLDQWSGPLSDSLLQYACPSLST